MADQQSPQQGEDEATPSLANKVLQGALAMIALRIGMRALGMVSTMFTARLLTPSDFGVVATGALITGFLGIFQDIGISEGLSRLKKAEGAHVETAWTMGLVQACGLAAIVLLSMPLAASLLNEPELYNLLPLTAVGYVLGSLASPGCITLLREMRFATEVKLRLYNKVWTILCTVAGAWIVGDFRGLVYGGLFAGAVYVALTYVWFPYRPRLTLSEWRNFLGFSLWTVTYGGGTWLAMTVDEIFARRLSDSATFGAYHTSRDLGRVFITESVAPATSVLVPSLARLNDEPSRLLSASTTAVGVGLIVSMGAATVVAGTAVDLLHLILGPQWLYAAAYLEVLAYGVAAQTVSELHRGITSAQGVPRVSALLWMARAAAMVVLCGAAALIPSDEALGRTVSLQIAWAYTVCCMVMMAIDYRVVFGRLGAPHALFLMLPATVVAGSMTSTLAHWLRDMENLQSLPVLLRLVVVGLLLAGSYGAIQAVIWQLRGRPFGPESFVMDRFADATRRLRRHRQQAA